MTALINYAVSLATLAVSIANSAINAAKSAYNDAVGWARTQINNAIAWLSIFIESAKLVAMAFANDLLNYAIAFARGVLNQAISFAVGLILAVYAVIDNVKIFLLSTIVGIQLFLMGLIENVRAAIIGLVVALIAPFMPLILWLQSLIDTIQAIIRYIMAFLTPENIAKLLNAIDNVIPFFTSFMADPLGFIASFVSEFLLPMLMWKLAYALGTTKYDLPPEPSWSAFIGLSGNNEVVLIDAKDPDLTRPLVSLYVSGNRFNPDHRGTDYGLVMGQPVYACHDGFASVGNCGDNRYGNCVSIQGEQWWSLYAHLQMATVANGVFVRKGQKIGLGDSTGNSTGPHLHIELRKNGVLVNPESVL